MAPEDLNALRDQLDARRDAQARKNLQRLDEDGIAEHRPRRSIAERLRAALGRTKGDESPPAS
jgi:hypothetical protein